MTHNVQGSAVDESSASARFAETLKKFKYSTSNDLDLPAVDDKAAPMAPDPALRQTRLKRGSTINFEEDVDATTTPSSAKRQRQSSKYAPPAKYAHLSPLQDIMEPNLIAIFVGFNPGVICRSLIQVQYSNLCSRSEQLRRDIHMLIRPIGFGDWYIHPVLPTDYGDLTRLQTCPRSCSGIRT